MEHKQLFFQKLTPFNDADISVYEEAIDFIFENEDITNVAISGAYSAGKSSVIGSYKKKHKNLKFLHISLAHFESQDENKKEDNVKESVLEGKILNQLIHQIPVDISHILGNLITVIFNYQILRKPLKILSL